MVNTQSLWQQLQAAWEKIVRLTCQEQGINAKDTEIIVAICYAESGMNPHAIHHNENGTTDYGILQINDFWHIGPKKDFPTSDYVLQNPQACIVWMCGLIKKNENNFNLWSTYKSNAYKKYLK
jgi:hypothetical protein